jgi:3-dehydroquinate synthase
VRDFSYTVRLPEETTRVLVGPLAGMDPAPVAVTGCLVVDAAAHAAAGPALAALAANLIREPSDPLVVEGGEELKDLGAVAGILEALSARGLDRSSLLVAAGGGSVLDACGFAAATFLRGIAFAAVPTTLLAQVDAAIGGKSAVNLGGAKNQAGVVRQPLLVLVDPSFTESLPERAFRSGLGELAKCALLAGGPLHALVMRRAAALLARDRGALEEAILLALRYKAGVVVRDPLDRGDRALLNAGHTAGHAIEAEAIRRGLDLPHGDAVSIGLLVEAAADAGSDRDAIIAVLDALRLPKALPFPMSAETARTLIERDKKRRGALVTLPVVKAPGEVELRDVPVSRIVEALTG